MMFWDIKKELSTPKQKESIKGIKFSEILYADDTLVFGTHTETINKLLEQIEIESQYAGYLDRQRDDISDFKKEENLLLPKNINYKEIGSLSNVIVEKLSIVQPTTLGAASRISGVTPAAIIALLRFVKKQKNIKAA